MPSMHPFLGFVASSRLTDLLPACDHVVAAWVGPVTDPCQACLVPDRGTLQIHGTHASLFGDLVLMVPNGIRRGVRVRILGIMEGGTFALETISIHAPATSPIYGATFPEAEPGQTGPRTVVVTIADASETVGPLEPLRAGDRVHAIHKLDFDRLEGDDGTESLLLTSYDMLFGSVADARCILVPEAMHAAMLEHARLLGTEVIDEAAVVLAPVAKPYEIGWATVSHKLIGLCNHEGRVRYVRG